MSCSGPRNRKYTVMRCWLTCLQAIAMGLTAPTLPTLSDDVDGKPSTQIATEYLMTLYAPLDPPQIVDDSLYIYNVAPGGWVKGPKISSKVVPPSGDWFRVMPSGVSRLDVRLSIVADDNQPILMTYNGIVRATKESMDRLLKGEVMKFSDDYYFITAPTFQTKSSKYAWLNGVQSVGKVVSVKIGDGSYVKYDIFIVR
jgi:hypothetical protein